MPLKQKRNVTNDNQIRTSFKMSLEYNSNYVIKVLSSSMKNALKLSFFPLYHTNINHTLTHSLTHSAKAFQVQCDGQFATNLVH